MKSSNKTDLRGKIATEIQKLIPNEKPFRAKQIFRWVHSNGIHSFDEMKNVPKSMLENLAEVAEIAVPKIATQELDTKTGTRKFALEFADNNQVECVLIPNLKGMTLCVSSQIGCALGCKFCKTATMGMIRNLTAGEIFSQFLVAREHAIAPITNIVFMGMGEPMMNFENVIRAADLLHHPDCGNISARKITISTAGVVQKISDFTELGKKYKLAISLNATTDELRRKLMPINQKNPLKSLLRSAENHAKKSGERVTFEYVMLDGVNMTDDDARRLNTMLRPMDCKLNLIPYNKSDLKFKRPTNTVINAFYEKFDNAPFSVLVRKSMGRKIKAACGQLTKS